MTIYAASEMYYNNPAPAGFFIARSVPLRNENLINIGCGK